MNIIHFITALENGGAEKMLFDTIVGLKGKLNHRVCVLSKRGIYCQKLADIGISVERLSFRLVWSLLFVTRKKYIVHSYLYHTHIASLLFKAMGYHVIWSTHNAFPNYIDLKVKLVGWLSYFVANKMVYVSNLAKQQHVNIGFNKKKTMVIYNGLDVGKFDISNKCRLGVNKDAINIGMIARYHPVKNYPRFALIAAEAVKINPTCHFYLVGKDNNKHNQELVNLLEKHGIVEKTTLVGEVSDISTALPCFDLVISTSKSESFGLTILEAILSGVNVSSICLDVMDELLGTQTCNEGDLTDDEIASHWLNKANNTPDDALIGYVREHYSVDKMVCEYLVLYQDFN